MWKFEFHNDSAKIIESEKKQSQNIFSATACFPLFTFTFPALNKKNLKINLFDFSVFLTFQLFVFRNLSELQIMLKLLPILKGAKKAI